MKNSIFKNCTYGFIEQSLKPEKEMESDFYSYFLKGLIDVYKDENKSLSKENEILKNKNKRLVKTLQKMYHNKLLTSIDNFYKETSPNRLGKNEVEKKQSESLNNKLYSEKIINYNLKDISYKLMIERMKAEVLGGTFMYKRIKK